MQIANMPEDEFDQMFICPYVTDCVKKDDETIVDVAVAELDDAYHGVIEKYMA